MAEKEKNKITEIERAIVSIEAVREISKSNKKTLAVKVISDLYNETLENSKCLVDAIVYEEK